MTIAVTAATGQLGRLVVARLKAKRPATEVVALARNPAKATDLGVTVPHTRDAAQQCGPFA